MHQKTQPGSKKTTHRMGENICKSYPIRVSYPEYTKNNDSTKKDKIADLKMGKGLIDKLMADKYRERCSTSLGKCKNGPPLGTQ